MTGTGQDPSIGTAKKSKPAMEKRRRARINASLLELRDLIPESKQRLNKMEKADILEMTVKHLKRLVETNKSLEKNKPGSRSYSLGFDECTQEVSEFFRPSSPFTSELKHNLLNHLQKCAPHNLPDSPSSSPSKDGPATTNSSNTNTSSSSINVVTNANNNNNNNSVNSTNVSGTVSVSIADSILSRCLLSTFPTSGIVAKSKSISSQSGQNAAFTSERKNVSTPIAVSSTSDDAPIEAMCGETSIQMVTEPAIEMDDLSSRVGLTDDRSPSPSQMVANIALTSMRLSKVRHNASQTHDDNTNVNAVKRDLLNAFQGGNGNNNNDEFTTQDFDDANNNNNHHGVVYREREAVHLKECEQSRFVSIGCKSELTTNDRQETHFNSTVGDLDANLDNKIFGNTGVTHISNMIFSRPSTQQDLHGDLASTPNSEIMDSSQPNEPIINNASKTDTSRKSVTSNVQMTVLPDIRVNGIDLNFPNHSYQKPVESIQTYLIPIYTQSKVNEASPGIPAGTQHIQGNENQVVQANDNKFSLMSFGPQGNVCHPYELNQCSVSCNDTNTKDTHEKQLVSPTRNISENTKSKIGFVDTTADSSPKSSCYNEMQNDSGYIEDDCDAEVTPAITKSSHYLRVKSTPLPLRIANSGSNYNSDDECHESGHITCDTVRNSIETKEWMWDYEYDSDDDYEYDSASGPTLPKRIRSTTDLTESNINDRTVESNNRKNSFGRRCNAFRFRQGSLSRRINVCKYRNYPLDSNTTDHSMFSNPSQQYSSNESLSHRNERMPENVDNNNFRRRCLTFSERPSRPMIPAMSTAWKDHEAFGNTFLKVLPKSSAEQSTSENINENAYITPGTRNISTSREFLTARRRCATVSAKDLLAKRPILSKRFMQSNGSVDSICEEEGVSSPSTTDANNATMHARGFITNSDVEGAVRYTKRRSTYSSSRASSAARELILTPSHDCQNDSHGMPFNFHCKLLPVSIGNEIGTKKGSCNEGGEISTVDRVNFPVNTSGGVPLSESKTREERVFQSNSNIQCVNASEMSTHLSLFQPCVDSKPCSTMTNPSVTPHDHSLPHNNVKDKNTNDDGMDLTNKLISDHNEFYKHFQNDGPITSSPRLYFEQQRPADTDTFHPNDSGPLNLSAKHKRNNAPRAFDTPSTIKFGHRHGCKNHDDIKTNIQFPSKVWSDEDELHRPRSWSVSSGMSSLSLGSLNRPKLFPRSPEDDDENVWRPW